MAKKMEGFWSMFCGKSGCAETGGNPCNYDFKFLKDPSTCVNHLLFICINVLLLIMILFTILKKSSQKPSQGLIQVQSYSKLQLVSAIANGSLGLIHLCSGIWLLEENLRRTQTALPLDWWMLESIQGLTWLLVGFTITLQDRKSVV